MRKLLILMVVVAATCPVFASGDVEFEWEIGNRFSTFEVLDNPVEAFELYKVKAKEPGQPPGSENPIVSLQEWHSALDQTFINERFTSPFADVSPWDSETETHRKEVMAFLDPNAEVDIFVRIDHEGDCAWQINEKTLPAGSCSLKRAVSIPLNEVTRVTVRHVQSGRGLMVDQEIQPHHELILGFGDSYGSGEGNPDGPTLWKTDFNPPARSYDWATRRQPIEKPATWVDHSCHRSFFSQQNLVALARASAHPHRLVTFLHYSCTGAEAFDGLFVPQANPGGAIGNEGLEKSQVNAALLELCQESPKSVGKEPSFANRYMQFFAKAQTDGTWGRTNGFSPEDHLLKCPSGLKKKPDLVLLSIGGNDTGFSDIIQYFVAPANYLFNVLPSKLYPAICPPDAVDGKTTSQTTSALDAYCTRSAENKDNNAEELLEQIPDKLAFSFDVLAKLLKISPGQIVLTQYPDPLRQPKKSGTNCHGLPEFRKTRFGEPRKLTYSEAATQPVGHLCGDKALYTNSMSAWTGLKNLVPTSMARQWQFNLTGCTPDNKKSTAKSDYQGSCDTALLFKHFSELRSQIEKGVADFEPPPEMEQPIFISEASDAFLSNGWWKGERLNWPTFSPTALDCHRVSHERKRHCLAHPEGMGRWDHWDWKPYAFEKEGRAVRTGNDSYLTQASFRGNAHYGMAHPNLRGHTLIADKVLLQIDPLRPLAQSP